mgnify:CR=1 FL=1
MNALHATKEASEMSTQAQIKVSKVRTGEASRSRLSGLAEPCVPGLVFRSFRGEADYPSMLAVIQGCREADDVERTDTLDDIGLPETAAHPIILFACYWLLTEKLAKRLNSDIAIATQGEGSLLPEQLQRGIAHTK